MQLLFMLISNQNFGEKDCVTRCTPTNSPTPNRRSRHPMIFVFDNLQSMGKCIKLVTIKSTKKILTFEKVGQLRSYDWLNWFFWKLRYWSFLFLSKFQVSSSKWVFCSPAAGFRVRRMAASRWSSSTSPGSTKPSAWLREWLQSRPPPRPGFKPLTNLILS